MSNRQQRRNRRHIFVDADGIHAATFIGEGEYLDGDRLTKVWNGEQLDNLPAGEHLWIFTAAFRCARPELATQQSAILDSETLLHVGGPGCYRCEQLYTPEIAARPCPGDP